VGGAGGTGTMDEIKESDPDPFGGDMSSIMIKPDQIHDDNIGRDWVERDFESFYYTHKVLKQAATLPPKKEEKE